MKHILSAKQFSKTNIDKIFKLTDEIKGGKYKGYPLKGKTVATLFYEPSTRTRLSFESAVLKLGGNYIATENAAQFSSAVKGETLEDTIRIIGAYSDLIVLRHFMSGSAEAAAQVSPVPIINAGDGDREHPTQALLDLYTIFSKSKNDNFTIAMVGDLAYGRTVHSLATLLSLYKNPKIIFVSPKQLSIPKEFKNYLIRKKTQFEESEIFSEILSKVDFIYMTRIQKERFKTKSQYQSFFGKFILNKELLSKIKKNAFILHPLPRVNEIKPEVDKDPRAIYFEQAQNGLFIRMAILKNLLG